MTLFIPGAVWAVLLVVGLTAVALGYFFGIEPLTAQATMMAVLSGVIALMLVLIVWLDHPFSGGVRVSSRPLEALLKYVAP